MSDPQSPLMETNPDALTRIFSADPLTLSDSDIAQLVVELRRRRSAFLSEEAVKSLAPKKSRTKAEPTSAPAAAALDKPPSELSLDDL